MASDAEAEGEARERQADALTLKESGLKRTLTRAEVVMISLGGAIGTGLFAGSGLAINYAGPAVLLSYALAGVAAMAMVFSLSEMATAHPAAGSFGVYAETYLNPFAGFLVRYTYWVAQVVAVGGEAAAVGVYMSFWFPATPVWLWSLGFASALLAVNARAVSSFGRFEYWFALIKVAAIIIFVVLGVTQILGLGRPAVGFHNLTGLPGGFMPHGLKGVWMAVIMGVFSYNGIEVIAVTSGEAKDPKTTIPAALRAAAFRLFLFYVLALGVVVSVVPWTMTGSGAVTGSPFVKVFAASGVREAAGVMNFVVITAALSSMNTNIYLSARMLFSLSRGGYAPSFLGRLGANGSPRAAILVSGAGILLAAAVSKLTPKAYSYLFGVALFGAILVWMTILVSHLRFRGLGGHLKGGVKTPFFPIIQFAALGLLAGVLVTMGLDPDWRISWIVGVPWVGALGLAYLLWRGAAGRGGRPDRARSALSTSPSP